MATRTVGALVLVGLLAACSAPQADTPDAPARSRRANRWPPYAWPPTCCKKWKNGAGVDFPGVDEGGESQF